MKFRSKQVGRSSGCERRLSLTYPSESPEMIQARTEFQSASQHAFTQKCIHPIPMCLSDFCWLSHHLGRWYDNIKQSQPAKKIKKVLKERNPKISGVNGVEGKRSRLVSVEAGMCSSGTRTYIKRPSLKLRCMHFIQPCTMLTQDSP